MPNLTAGKIAEVVFEKSVDTFEEQTTMLGLVDAEGADDGKLQNSGDVVHYPVQQHRPVLSGFDLNGQEQGIIEETYPISLSTPKGDLIEQRIDNMRDRRFWERAGVQSGMQQATDLNTALADLIADTGSLYYRSNDTSGFDFISKADSLIEERQVYKTMGCNYLLNVRDNNKFAKDLASRQTVDGRPEEAWSKNQVGRDVSNFDVYKGSFLKNLTGAANVGTTISADVSEKPEGGTVDPVTKTVTNIDYRRGSLPVADSSSFVVGDYITVGAVQSIGLASKNPSGQLMTFKVVAIPDGTTLEVFPKPIALDDPALTKLEAAHANIDTQIKSTDAVARINIATAKNNLFWCKDSIQLVGARCPWNLMDEFAGMKHLSKTLPSGVTMDMVYDGNMKSATLAYRLFFWYGLANRNPMANGVAHTF